MAISDWFARRVFNVVHRRNLVYNTCWEDPRLDREALAFQPSDNVLVITSAGCNALDYALTGPQHVYSVDMNPRQNALLQLKIAAIRELEFDDFFRMFGEGYYPRVPRVYEQQLRPHLDPWSQAFWDKRIKWFNNRRHSFYFRGTSGTFARLMKIYTDRVIKVRPYLDELLDAETLEQQNEIYYRHLRDRFWTGFVKFALSRDTILSMLGVPRAQRRQVESNQDGGVVEYVRDRVEAVFTRIPLKDNYFWRLYMTGRYTTDCCPEYLKEPNFERLRSGLVDRVSTHTDSVQGFLEKFDGQITKFTLLDHMDWLSDHFFPMLEAEWQAIVNRAESGARLIWRSGSSRTDFVNDVQIRRNGRVQRVSELLVYHPELADRLHQQDRVHTYASFHIADLPA